MSEKTEKEYICPWPRCGHKFTRTVGHSGSGNSRASSQVVCPRCGNGLKTWASKLERNLVKG